ncbi:MAG: PAS domain S-box protein [Syntrophothermus sp.]
MNLNDPGKSRPGERISKVKSEDAEKYELKMLRIALESVNGIVFQTGSSGLFTFLNPAWEIITGFGRSETLNMEFSSFVAPEHRQMSSGYMEDLLAGRKPKMHCEVRYMKKNGGFCWMEVYAVPVKGEDGKIIGASGMLTDITQKKFQEDEIRKLSKAVENAPLAVVLTNLMGKITFVNKGMLNISGYRREADLLHRVVFDFTDQSGKEKLINEVLPLIYEDKIWQGEIELLRADGTEVPVNIICSLIKDEFGNPQQLLANFTDISNLKKAEAESRNALMRERELNEMRSRFVSLVSHEFRTPLAAILSSAEILEYYSEKFTPEKKAAHYEKIKTSISNLLDILNEISEINQIDSGRVIPLKKKIAIEKFMQEIMDEINTGYQDRPEIIISRQLDSLDLFTDKKLLRQIVINLISNAVKYTPETKKVFINIINNQEEFTIEVKDEGSGIPEQDQSLIFEPFSRSSNVSGIKGSGLGLSIVKKAVETLNGILTFQSTEGEGSVFTVSLPQKD